STLRSSTRGHEGARSTTSCGALPIASNTLRPQRRRRGPGEPADLRQSNDGSSDSGQWSRALDRLQQRQGNVGRLVVELAEDFRKAQAQSQGAPGGAGDPAGESSEETPGEDPEKAPGDGGDGDGDNGGGDDAEE
ncbi:MAG: hypothetical protein MK133_09525, partial [Planctomycetes bacterium]|nr:hypothetical protein [Planctomycetota bacterium]